MQLIIEIENAQHFDEPIPSQGISPNEALSIGRSDKADWKLNDKSRLLSSIHCLFEYDEENLFVTDQSKNGTLLNNKALQKNLRIKIYENDQISIGPYQLTIKSNRHQIEVNEEEQTVIAGTHKITPKPAEYDSNPLRENHEVNRQNLEVKPSESKEFLGHFANAANIDKSDIIGRNDDELGIELGQAFYSIAKGVIALKKYQSQVEKLSGSSYLYENAEDYDENQLSEKLSTAEAILMLLNSKKSGKEPMHNVLEDTFNDLEHSQYAIIDAMQTALFKLLNDLSPIEIEKATGSSALFPKKKKNWDQYIDVWEKMSKQGDNGMLDVFLMHFKEAYDHKMAER